MPLSAAELAAREALRARQGRGARYDAPNAPAEELLLARRGTAFFARKLMELPDAALYEPSATAGLTRAHVVVRVSYAARRQALMLEALAGGGDPGVLPEEAAQSLPEPALAATLPARAIRHLFHHSEVHLNVCWRDLTEAQWDMAVALHEGGTITPRSLPMRRAREVWLGALELGNGAMARDLPPALREAAGG